MEKLNYTKSSEFIPINQLLLEDNEEVKKIKSIYKKEAEYAQFLGPIELFIATYYYYDDPKICDLDAAKAIENIRANLEKGTDFFKSIFEKELMGVISFTLQKAEGKITRHELLLILGYILWCIDNRRWLGDKRGYLNWLCSFFDIFDKEEKKQFNRFYDMLGKKFGIEKEELKTMKNESYKYQPPSKDDILNVINAQNFAAYGDKAQKTEIEDDSFWKEGSFIESMSKEDMEKKMRTFHMKHDEEMNYNCKKCNKKISAHNKDWHANMCDDCFDKI